VATLSNGSTSLSHTPCAENTSKAKMSKKLQKEKSKKKAEEDLVAVQKKCVKHSRALRGLVSSFVTADRRAMEVLDDGSEEYKEWAAAFNKVHTQRTALGTPVQVYHT
jgi:hypothetical protein